VVVNNQRRPELLEKLGGLETAPRRVEACYTAVIRHYVKMGFGIGLVVGLPGRRAASNLQERSMSRYFGLITVKLVWRQGALHYPPALNFAEVLRKHIRQASGDRAITSPRAAAQAARRQHSNRCTRRKA
jgi:hypothetical protein